MHCSKIETGVERMKFNLPCCDFTYSAEKLKKRLSSRQRTCISMQIRRLKVADVSLLIKCCDGFLFAFVMYAIFYFLLLEHSLKFAKPSITFTVRVSFISMSNPATSSSRPKEPASWGTSDARDGSRAGGSSSSGVPMSLSAPRAIKRRNSFGVKHPPLNATVTPLEYSCGAWSVWSSRSSPCTRIQLCFR